VDCEHRHAEIFGWAIMQKLQSKIQFIRSLKQISKIGDHGTS